MNRTILELCLFCPRPANSHEHLFSDWLRELFPHGDRPRYTSTKAAYRRTDTKEFDEEMTKYHRIHKRPLNTLKLQVVCGPCNERWLSRMESRTKPILTPLITGQTLTLNRRHLKILARWIAKTTIVNEVGFGEGAVVPATHHKIIRSNGRLPADWKIYMGQASESGGLGITHNTATFVLPPNADAKRLPGYANCTVIFLGALILFVFVSNGPFVVKTDQLCLVPIAPITKDANWPPKPKSNSAIATSFFWRNL